MANSYELSTAIASGSLGYTLANRNDACGAYALTRLTVPSGSTLNAEGSPDHSTTSFFLGSSGPHAPMEKMFTPLVQTVLTSPIGRSDPSTVDAAEFLCVEVAQRFALSVFVQVGHGKVVDLAVIDMMPQPLAAGVIGGKFLLRGGHKQLVGVVAVDVGGRRPGGELVHAIGTIYFDVRQEQCRAVVGGRAGMILICFALAFRSSRQVG